MAALLALLPFFVMPFNGDMEMQFRIPKMMGLFLIGNVCMAAYLCAYASVFLGVAHAGFSACVLFSGFGGWQIYPYAYWTSAVAVALWVGCQKHDFQVTLWKAVAIGGIVSAVQAFLQTQGITWPLQYAEGIDNFKPIAFFGQHTLLGAFLAPVAAICMGLGWFPACALVSLVVLMTGSSFSALSLVVGLFFAGKGYIRPSRRWKIAGLGVFAGGLSLAGSLIWFPHADFIQGNGRVAVFQETVSGAMTRPWFGYGPGGFYSVFHKVFESQRTRELHGMFFQAHNDYLQVLFDGGIVGVLCLVVVLCGIFHAFWRVKDVKTPFVSCVCAQGALSALLVNACGNFPFQLGAHILIGAMSAGILLKCARADTMYAWQQQIYFR